MIERQPCSTAVVPITKKLVHDKTLLKFEWQPYEAVVDLCCSKGLFSCLFVVWWLFWETVQKLHCTGSLWYLYIFLLINMSRVIYFKALYFVLQHNIGFQNFNCSGFQNQMNVFNNSTLLKESWNSSRIDSLVWRFQLMREMKLSVSLVKKKKIKQETQMSMEDVVLCGPEVVCWPTFYPNDDQWHDCILYFIKIAGIYQEYCSWFLSIYWYNIFHRFVNRLTPLLPESNWVPIPFYWHPSLWRFGSIHKSKRTARSGWKFA